MHMYKTFDSNNQLIFLFLAAVLKPLLNLPLNQNSCMMDFFSLAYKHKNHWYLSVSQLWFVSSFLKAVPLFPNNASEWRETPL